MNRNVFRAGWVVWGLLFVGWEGLALFNGQEGDTLSETVWSWFDVDAHAWTYKRYALVAFMIWLSAHFIFRTFATRAAKRKASREDQ